MSQQPPPAPSRRVQGLPLPPIESEVRTVQQDAPPAPHSAGPLPPPPSVPKNIQVLPFPVFGEDINPGDLEARISVDARRYLDKNSKAPKPSRTKI